MPLKYCLPLALPAFPNAITQKLTVSTEMRVHARHRYVEEIMNMEAAIIKEWEAFLPEAKAIAL
jgi:hypothetical protein